MAKPINAFYCTSCKTEQFLPANTKSKCPRCGETTLISLECSQEEYESYTKEEQEIIIESNILRERKKNERMQYKIENPYADNTELLRKIATDTAVTKWCVIGFSALCILIYLLEEIL